MFASSVGAWLPMLSFVVLGAWQTTGIPFFLGIAVASMLALVVDALVSVVSMRDPKLRLRAPESKVLTVARPHRFAVVEASPPGAVMQLVSSMGGSNSTRAGSGAPIVAQYRHRSVHTDAAGIAEVIGPLGLVVCQRRFLTPLAFAVGPRDGERSDFPEAPKDQDDEQPEADVDFDPAAVLLPQAAEENITRSVRPYRRGDQQTAVAWKATARTGELMVRELEGFDPVETEVVLMLALREPKNVKSRRTTKSRVQLAELDELNEDAVARAAAFAKGAMRAGQTVRLILNQEMSEPAERKAPLRRGKMRLMYVVGESAVTSEVVRNETHLAYLLAAAVPGGDLRGKVRESQTATSDQPVFAITPTGDRWMSP